MKTCLECRPCLAKLAVDLATRSTDQKSVQQAITAEAFRSIANDNMTMPPAFQARKVMDIAIALSGSERDLFREEKRKSALLAEELLAKLDQIREYNAEDFESRLRLAIAGNMLDFGIYCGMDMEEALKTVKLAFTRPIDRTAAEQLKKQMDSAKHILYILDNCGEAVFDREFMAPYSRKITLAVRGRNALNDVTAAEIAESGLSQYAGRIVDNGPSGIPGVVPELAGRVFNRVFQEADLIIAKGQGNFESLNECDRPIAFLFLVKCPVLVREIGAELYSSQIRLYNMP